MERRKMTKQIRINLTFTAEERKAVDAAYIQAVVGGYRGSVSKWCKERLMEQVKV